MGAATGEAPSAGRRLTEVSDLIDTTEMYLRTIFELEEEGIVPLRAGSPSGWATPARPSPRPWRGWSATACCRSPATATWS